MPITPKLELRLLGTPQILLDDQPVRDFVTRKAQALLIYVADSEQVHMRDALAGFFWRDLPDVQAKNNLRRVLPNLRKLVGSHLRIDRHQIALEPAAPHFVDALRFEQTLTALDRASRAAEVSPADLESVLGLYRDDFLAGFYVRDAPSFEEWVLTQREHYRELAIRGFTALARLHLQRRAYEAGLAATNRLLLLEPWYETAHHLQMMLLAHGGQRSAALAQYELCRTMLADEFGAQPSAEMTTLYERLQASGLTEPRPPTITTPVEQIPETPVVASGPHVDWGEMPRATLFVGRQREMNDLLHWLLDDRCALISILGTGGTGKTTLAAAVLRTLAGVGEDAVVDSVSARTVPFTRILWRSLLNAPPLSTLLPVWLHALSPVPAAYVPDSLDEQLALLFTYLRQQPCLLVLDNVESILQEGTVAGQWRPGYEEYGLLVRRMGETRHQSCLLLTSREQPLDVGRLERDYSEVRSLRLSGLPVASGVEVLRAAGLDDASAQTAALVQCYSGNPLALRLVAETVRELYGGNIGAFLQGATPIFDDIRTVLAQQFARLSPLEQDVLVWLAVERDPVTSPQLVQNWAHPPAPQQLLAALRSLQRRSLVEPHESDGQTETIPHFALQNVVMEYVTARVVETMHDELTARLPTHDLDSLHHFTQSWFNRYALVKAQSKEYVRTAQQRLILQPLLDRLLATLGADGVIHRLRAVLEQIHHGPPRTPGYAAANLLHLLLHLSMERTVDLTVDLAEWDFSHLMVRQADLRHAELAGLNVTGSDLTDSVFLDTFHAVLDVAFSADGTQLAAATTAGEITLWRMDTLQPQVVCHAGADWIRAVAFSPRADLLAAASVDHAIYLFDAKTGHLVETLKAHEAEVRAVAFHPDGDLLASASMDHTVRLWDVERGELRQTVRHHDDFVLTVAFSPDGTLLASGGGDRVIRLWRVAEATAGEQLEGHTAAVTKLAFCGGGQTLVSSSADQTVRLWDLVRGQQNRTFEGHTAEVESIAIHPQGRMLASGCQNGELRLWDLATGQCQRVWTAHAATVWSLAFSRDGHTLVSGSNDYTVRLWDPDSGEAWQTLRGYNDQIWGIVRMPGTDDVVSGSGSGRLRLWNAETGSLGRQWHAHDGAVRALAVSVDGAVVASGGADRLIRLWNAATGQLQRTLTGHAQRIFGLAFHPDGRILASCGGDGTIRLWWTRTGRLHQTLEAHRGRVSAIVFSPDGQVLVSCGYDRQLYLWDVQADATVQLRDALDYRGGFGYQLAFSPDGAYLSIASNTTPDVQLWDVQMGTLIRTLQGQHAVSVDCAAFAPDGSQLATGSVDRMICIWDVPSGTLRHRLAGHTAAVRSLLWFDAGTLVSCSGDETIRIWQVQSGACMHTLSAAGPYAGMNITDATGLSDAQRVALLELGAQADHL